MTRTTGGEALHGPPRRLRRKIDIAAAQKMIDCGNNLYDIAVVFGVTYEAVHCATRDGRLRYRPARPGEPYRKKKRVGAPPNHLALPMLYLRKPGWDVRRAQRMLDEGVGPEEIARQLGVYGWTIRRAIKLGRLWDTRKAQKMLVQQPPHTKPKPSRDHGLAASMADAIREMMRAHGDDDTP